MSPLTLYSKAEANISIQEIQLNKGKLPLFHQMCINYLLNFLNIENIQKAQQKFPSPYTIPVEKIFFEFFIAQNIITLVSHTQQWKQIPIYISVPMLSPRQQVYFLFHIYFSILDIPNKWNNTIWVLFYFHIIFLRFIQTVSCINISFIYIAK